MREWPRSFCTHTMEEEGTAVSSLPMDEVTFTMMEGKDFNQGTVERLTRDLYMHTSLKLNRKGYSPLPGETIYTFILEDREENRLIAFRSFVDSEYNIHIEQA